MGTILLFIILMIQKTLSSLLREFCKVISTMSNNKKGLNLIVLNLEKIMKHTMFLETETGKLTIADVYTTNQQLFLVIF